MDERAVDPDLYREALSALRDVLLHGCRDCVRNAVTYLVLDMKWPAHRGLQIVFIEELLRRSAPAVH